MLKKGEYAALKGWHPSYVTKLLKTGKIIAHNGRIDPAEADRMLAESGDPSKEYVQQRHAAARGATSVGYQPTSFSASFNEAKTAREIYAAKNERIKYEQAIGELVPADEVKIAAFNAARLVRDALLNIPDRLAPILAAENDEHKIHTMLLAEINNVLNDLSNRIDGAPERDPGIQ